jgi:hypothetical protein
MAIFMGILSYIAHESQGISSSSKTGTPSLESRNSICETLMAMRRAGSSFEDIRTTIAWQ